LVRISTNFRRYYWRNLMPSTTINVCRKNCYIKHPLPPHLVYFFSLSSVSLLLHFSSPLRLHLVFWRDFIILVVVLKGMYSFFSLSLYFFYFNHDFFFMFFVLCIVCG
jgi:hypothetical protein